MWTTSSQVWTNLDWLIWVVHFQESPFLNGSKTGAFGQNRSLCETWRLERYAQRRPACPHSLLLCIKFFFPTARPINQASPPDAWLWTHRNSSYTETAVLINFCCSLCLASQVSPGAPTRLPAPALQGDWLVTSSKSARPPSRSFLSQLLP